MDAFLDPIADALASLLAVRAVSLGGSRAQGTARPDSDWDLAIYYRGAFRPDDLRGLADRSGWTGEVSEVGAWGGGIFNGGAWLTVDGTGVDLHYPDLDVVEAQLVRAERGEFDVEPLMFHLTGIPTYLLVAELAINVVLHGSLPGPAYPVALRDSASREWAGRATLTLDYAAANHAPRGRLAQCAGLMVLAATQFAHAILAARGHWVTNEKGVLERAGLDEVDDIVGGLTTDPATLCAAAGRLRALGERLASERSHR
jgi:hypothetical protein